ncbi:MAG: hypothetical protein LBR79_03945 [Oscillospiraceae bacterium]|jgi:hypothetical protein|nr:hypothetical protein [Oscillospiraceae bacterium]
MKKIIKLFGVLTLSISCLLSSPKAFGKVFIVSIPVQYDHTADTYSFSFFLEISDESKKKIEMAIRNKYFEAVQFFRRIERIYKTDTEGNLILTGVKLNDFNKDTAVRYSVALIKIILETGNNQVIPDDSPTLLSLTRDFNYNLPEYVANILYFLGLIKLVVPT